MKITIGHLFYDLLNLYGESGNVLALKYALETQGIEVEILNLSLGDDIDFDKLDFVYIGAGTKQNLNLALDYLKKYTEDISQYITCNKFFLATGNSIELFGKYIKEADNSQTISLGLFDYYTEISLNRFVSECVFKCEFLKNKLLGFENHIGTIKNSTSPLFTVIKGNGDNTVEGFFTNNFYATYILGPILARNPELLEYITRKLITEKFKDFEFKEFDFELLKKAHNKFIEKYN